MAWMPEEERADSAQIRVAGIVEESIVDGPGLRLSLFVQGCPHHCPGCHNPQTHAFAGGTWMTAAEVLARFREDPLLAGITLTGGEPFCQAGPLCAVAAGVKADGKNVVTYTGYTLEQLEEMARQDAAVHRLLELTDLLVDGPFIEAQRDLDLLFRGSANQRLLDLRAWPAEVRPWETW